MDHLPVAYIGWLAALVPFTALGAEAVARPEFCTRSTYSSSIDAELAKRDYASLEVSREIAAGQCEKPIAKPEKAQAIDEHFTQWQEFNGFTDEEAQAFLAAVIDNKVLAGHTKTACQSVAVEDADSAPYKERAAAGVLAVALGCAPKTKHTYDWPDADPLVQGLDIAACFTALHQTTFKGTNLGHPIHYAEYAACEARAARYDLAGGLSAARSRQSLSPYARARMVSLLRSGLVQARESMNKAFGKAIARGEAYRKVMVEAPQRAYSEWMSTYAKHQAQLDEAWWVVSNGDNPAQAARHKGCEGRYLNSLQSAIQVRSVKTLNEAKDILATPHVGLLAAAYAQCEAMAGNESIAATYADYALGMLTTGPGEAAYQAALSALVENRNHIKEAKDAALKVRSFKLPRWEGGNRGVAAGTIASLKKMGSEVTVTFKKEIRIEPVFDCVETNRIDRIQPDGKVVYREDCTPAGTRKVTTQEAPISVPATQSAALQVGRFATFWRARFGEGVSMPYKVYTDKSQKKLAGLIGLKLK